MCCAVCDEMILLVTDAQVQRIVLLSQLLFYGLHVAVGQNFVRCNNLLLDRNVADFSKANLLLEVRPLSVPLAIGVICLSFGARCQ